MTDVNQTVGTPAPNGAAGKPNQPVSPAQNPIDGDVAKLLAGLGEKFDGLQKELRGLQGRQDKSENNFQAQLARLEQYEKQGLSRPEAVAKMQSDDAAESRWTNLEKKLDTLAAQFANGGTQANDNSSVAKVFESLGLDLKDTRVASALVRKYENADQVELTAYRLQRELAQSPNPTSAQSASLLTGTPRQVDTSALREDYIKEIQTMRGNRQGIKAVQDKYRKLGFDTGSVDFRV